jgi:hypothetical protein
VFATAVGRSSCEAFMDMRATSATPDRFLLPQVLRACAWVGAHRLGAAAHAIAAKGGAALTGDPFGLVQRLWNGSRHVLVTGWDQVDQRVSLKPCPMLNPWLPLIP